MTLIFNRLCHIIREKLETQVMKKYFNLANLGDSIRALAYFAITEANYAMFNIYLQHLFGAKPVSKMWHTVPHDKELRENIEMLRKNLSSHPNMSRDASYNNYLEDLLYTKLSAPCRFIAQNSFNIFSSYLFSLYFVTQE